MRPPSRGPKCTTNFTSSSSSSFFPFPFSFSFKRIYLFLSMNGRIMAMACISVWNVLFTIFRCCCFPLLICVSVFFQQKSIGSMWFSPVRAHAHTHTHLIFAKTKSNFNGKHMHCVRPMPAMCMYKCNLSQQSHLWLGNRSPASPTATTSCVGSAKTNYASCILQILFPWIALHLFCHLHFAAWK